jgi:pimeloyl-ACP methyl ester carboxylesterase
VAKVVSGYVDVNGVQLHYLRAGQGPRSLVFTHGNSHCAGVWRPLIEVLAGDDITAVAVDLRGHGWSDKPDSGYEWRCLRDDVVGLVHALDLVEVVYVGHSRGGGVALLTAAATPERARGVLAYEPTVPVQAGADGAAAPVPEPAGVRQSVARALRRRDRFDSRAALVERYRAQEAFRHWREDYFQSFIDFGSAVQEDGSVELCMPPRTAARLFEATFGFDTWQDVHCPTLPVQLIYGEHSGRLGNGRDPVAGIRTMFPRATIHVMEGATHTGPMEQPERFEQEVRAFAGRAWSR